MQKRTLTFAALGLLLAACAPMPPEPDPALEPQGPDLPEGVISMAAPGQDLSTARIMADGCYWYDHVGPVETTPLPLKTVDGRPICGPPAPQPTGA